jgi:hypothetical protein
VSYHKGYSKEQAVYAHRKAVRKHSKTKSQTDVLSKEIVVWDGEGMKLSGPDKPQHYVLFGCSARPDSPLVIDKPHGRLEFEEIADYCLSVVKEHPNAIHLGYYFSYDQNMIIWSLPWPAKEAIYYENACVVKRGMFKYYVRMIPRKSIRITRINQVTDDKVSILIEDMATFFASSFVKAYETLFKNPTDLENWEIVKQGKADRATTEYKDLGKVRRYWRAEILALYELAFEFRRIMFDANFYLREWHGPGALANYIRRENDLIRHEWGGKEENLLPAVHEAIKGAYFGGRFEQYRVGYIQGPIYSYDKNSAYPTAFCEVPTLEKGGEWRNIGAMDSAAWLRDKRISTSFGVFKIRWLGRRDLGVSLGINIQPFPHRDSKKNISFPMHTIGWYWAPEVKVAVICAKRADAVCEILDGWVWEPLIDDIWPWESLFRAMYKRRAELKRNKNPTQMAFKLGLNSMYGKMAQRAGGKEEAPKSHTLCIAGYVTSSCRASVTDFMLSCPQDTVISVETDGVYTTVPPDQLKPKFVLGNDLGEWSHEVYDAMIILQSGVYLLKQNGKWLAPKSRGISATAFQNENGETDPAATLAHLANCEIGERWKPMVFDGGEAFLGLGAAIARATRTIKHGPKAGRKSVNPFKAADLHCTWHPDGSNIDLEGKTSKRTHIAKECRACRRKEKPDITWHDLFINSAADKGTAERESSAYVLPWEKEYKEEEWHRDLLATQGTPETHL